MALSARDVVDIRDERVHSVNAQTVWALNKSYTGHHQERISRIERLERAVTNQWGMVYPDGSGGDAEALIGNVIARDLEDVADLVGGVDPTVFVDPLGETDRHREDATLLQQVLAHYRRVNRLGIKRRSWGMDLAGTGAAFCVVWPDFSGLTQAEIDRGGDVFKTRYPLYIREDPRYCLPDPSMTDPSDIPNCVVSRRVKLREVERIYPGAKRALFTETEINTQKVPDEVELVDFYGPDVTMKVVGTGSGKNARLHVLAELENKVGKPLIVMAMRPTFDGQIRGQFDEAIAPLATANRIMRMRMDMMADIVYAEKIVRGHFSNPQDIGPGGVLFTSEPANQANIERVRPADSSPQAFADMQILQEQARLASGVPQARQGDVEQNIASAAFVNAIQGKYTTKIAAYQSLVADLEERANALALSVDESYLAAERKPIAGTAEGRRFSTSYTPRTAISGRYDNRVVFGDGTGLDQFNRKAVLERDMRSGIISRRRARIEGTKIEDIDAEERQIERESIRQSVLAGLALPDAPLEIRLEALRLSKDGKNIEEIAEELQVRPAEPPAPPGPLPTGQIGGTEPRDAATAQQQLPPLQDLLA